MDQGGREREEERGSVEEFERDGKSRDRQMGPERWCRWGSD